MLLLILFLGLCWCLGTGLWNYVNHRRWSLCTHTKGVHQVVLPPEVCPEIAIYRVICNRCGVQLGEFHYPRMMNYD
jgi:hypothetical protein